MIEVYKYMNKKYSVDDFEMLPRYTSVGLVTKGHNMKLKKSNCNGQRKVNLFGLRVVNTWNQLQEGVAASTSVNCFKGRYDRFVSSASYQTTAQTILETTNPRA